MGRMASRSPNANITTIQLANVSPGFAPLTLQDVWGNLQMQHFEVKALTLSPTVLAVSQEARDKKLILPSPPIRPLPHSPLQRKTKQTDRTNRQIILNPFFSSTHPNHLLYPLFTVILPVSCSECLLNN